jgi:hypothetical protein
MVLGWQGLGWRQRLSYWLGLGLPVGLVMLLFLKDRFATGLATIANEGSVLLPDLSLYGWPIIALASVGLLLAWLRGPVEAYILTLFCGLLALEGGALWLAKIYLNQGSYYAIYKLFYPAVYLFPMLAAWGLHSLLLALPQLKNLKLEIIDSDNSKKLKIIKSWLLGVSSLILFGFSFVTMWLEYPQAIRPFPVFTQDSLQVAYWMRDNLKPGEFSVAYNMLPGTPAYWLQIGVFKQPRSNHSNDLLTSTPPTFEAWLHAPDSPPYFVTDNLNALKLDERVQLLYQSGNVGVLTRTPAYYQQATSRTELSLQYKASLAKGSLALRIEATMSDDVSSWLKVGLQIENADTNQLVFEGILPVQANRKNKQQFLGIVTALPSLEVKEFYANNDFPTKPAALNPLAPAHYLAYLTLQKQGVNVERTKLTEFDYNPNGQLTFADNTTEISSQLAYEGLTPSSLPNFGPLNFDQADNDDYFQLTGLSLPSQTKIGTTAPVTLQWNITNPVKHAYWLRWAWLDSAGNVAAEEEAPPLNDLFPTWLWPASSQPVIIKQDIKLPDQPGRYQLALSLFDPSSPAPVELKNLGQFIQVN